MVCNHNCHECMNSRMVAAEMCDDKKIFAEEVEILKPVYTCTTPESSELVPIDSEVNCAKCTFAELKQLSYTYNTEDMDARQLKALDGCSCYMEVVHCKLDPPNVYRLPTMRCAMGIPLANEEKHTDCTKVPYTNDHAWDFRKRQI